MFHTKQSSLTALISRVLGKGIGSLINAIARHPLITGTMILAYLITANPAIIARLQSTITASDFPETALGALILSALVIALVYAFTLMTRQILATLRNDE